MENAQNKPVQPKNIFEAINQNIVDMSTDNVAMYQLIQNMEARFEQMAAKVEQIHAALYPAMPERKANEIPEGSPNDPGEDEGSENE